MAKIIVIANQKGGVAKTTTVHSLIAILNQKGYKTLGIDMDPQCNLSSYMDCDCQDNTLYQLFKDNSAESFQIKDTKEGYALIVGSELLSAADIEFKDKGREYILKEALATMQSDYDFIVIDTPPHLGILMINAFVAADIIVVPIMADKFSLLGLNQLYANYLQIKQQYNPSITIGGLLLTRYSDRNIVSRQIKSQIALIAKNLDTKLYDTAIRSSVATTEAQMLGKSITDYNDRSTTAIDYNSFVDELLGGIFCE